MTGFTPPFVLETPVVVAQVGAVEPSRNSCLEQLARRFQDTLTQSPTKAAGAILASAAQELGAVAAIACAQGPDGRILPVHVSYSASARGAGEAFVAELMTLARETCLQRQTKTAAATSMPGHEIVAAPLLGIDERPGVVVICLPSAKEWIEPNVTLVLYTAAWIALAGVREKSTKLARDETPPPPGDMPRSLHDEHTASLSRICLDAASAEDLNAALCLLANRLQDWLECDIVCIALAHGTTGARLAAISKVATFDRHSEIANAIESASRATILLDRVQEFPGRDQDPALESLTALCRQTGSSHAVIWPCKDRAGLTVGTCLALWSDNHSTNNERVTAVSGCAHMIGATLKLLHQGHATATQRMVRGLIAFTKALVRCRNMGIALVLVSLVLCAPWPYHLPCECAVEPVIRRYVSAPFDGILDRALVRPGDRVRRDDELARMDGRELAMQLAAKQATVDQSRQRHTAALAKRDAAAAQLASMEMQQAGQEVGLLEERRRNLAIRSPIDGIVISGDLLRAEGVPLTVGQKLFEVAPLDRMIVEIAIPEHEVGAVAEEQAVSLSLDAFPGVVLQGTVSRLHPQAEIRNQRNVFVAEVELEANDVASDVALLPGMSGKAHIEVGARPAAWILLHRPWHFLRSKIVW